jgi:hypothetical protein
VQPRHAAAHAISLVPEAIARTLRLAPVSAGARTLTIAVAAPLSGDQVRALVEITGRQLISELEPGPDVVDAMIEAAYGDRPQIDSTASAA